MIKKKIKKTQIEMDLTGPTRKRICADWHSYELSKTIWL
jgi:hypothetical protein